MSESSWKDAKPGPSHWRGFGARAHFGPRRLRHGLPIEHPRQNRTAIPRHLNHSSGRPQTDRRGRHGPRSRRGFRGGGRDAAIHAHGGPQGAGRGGPVILCGRRSPSRCFRLLRHHSLPVSARVAGPVARTHFEPLARPAAWYSPISENHSPPSIRRPAAARPVRSTTTARDTRITQSAAISAAVIRQAPVQGHQLGLCQTGAAGMAATGVGFREILDHYYPATSVIFLLPRPPALRHSND